MLIGHHVSISGSIDLAINRALSVGCTTFQIFTTNPRGWVSRNLKNLEINQFILKKEKSSFNKIFSHMPYLPNLASPKIEIHQKSINSLIEEIKRCEKLGISYLVTHPGSHLGQGLDKGIKNIQKAINTALSSTATNIKILIENTSGSGNIIGSTFKEIKAIIDGVIQEKKVGVCFDTCHAFAAGYDIKSNSGIIDTINELEEYFGLEKIELIHLNDSKGKLGSKLDRHQHIGLGEIGVEGFHNFFTEFKTRIPVILETPIDSIRSDKENLEVTKRIIQEILKN